MNKISCTDLREELSAFVDGQVDATVNAAISVHLQSCQSCSQQMEVIKSLSRFLAQGASLENVPDIWERMKGDVPSVCSVIEEDLSAYLDGELSASAQEGVNKHLKECGNCLTNFRSLNVTNTFISRELELPHDVKVDIWPLIRARLNEDCALIQSELSAYADQEVVTLRHRTITSHLAECLNCRNSFNRLSLAADVIRESYKPVIPDDFDLWPDIRRKLQVVPFASKTTARKDRTRSWSRRAYLSATAAVVVGITGLVTFFVSPLKRNNVEPISSETYLIESALNEPIQLADAVVFEEQ